MQSQNRILDDFAKLLTNAAGAAQGVRKEVESIMRQQADKLIAEFDLVPREDFEVVRTMATKAREENVKLTKRVEAIEKTLNGKRSSSASTKTRKTAKRKTASPKKQS